MESTNKRQGFLRPIDAANWLGVSRSKIHDLEKNDPTFPKKVILGPRCVGWRMEDLKNWINKKAQ